MSTRTNLRPQSVITNGDMSLASLTSAPTILQSLTKVSYSAKWTNGGTPVGTIIVQVSNDYSLNPDGSVNNAGSWNTIPLQLSDGSTATSVAVSGNTGNGFIDVVSGAYAVRLVYTRTSGSGTLNVIVNCKVS